MSSYRPIFGIVLGIGALLAAACVRPTIRLAYNPSDSAPRGWYLVVPVAQLHVGDYVVARLPRDVAVFAESRNYLPRTVPILKQVGALDEQLVCIRDATVYIDGIAVARVLTADGKQRPLTAWAHCRSLQDGELFLLSSANVASFDSRYFGPIDASFVRGRAIPLLTEALQ